jgi:glutamate/tyrosine decarboxylase-like PLP-dependent enzyme
VDLLAMRAITVRTGSTGEMDYGDLRRVLGQHRDRAAIVVANIGSTMTEAVDDTARIKALTRSTGSATPVGNSALNVRASSPDTPSTDCA